MSLLNWVIGTRIANPMGLAKETGFNLVILTEVAKGHGSAMSIGSLDSSKCKGTLVLDSGPRHDSIEYHGESWLLARSYWHSGPPGGLISRCLKSWR